MTLLDLISASARSLADAGVSFGHGTTNAHDEAAWLVLWQLGLPLDTALDGEASHAHHALTAEQVAKVQALIALRIQSRKPAAYLTREAWLQGFAFYVDERVIVPRSYFAELLREDLAPWVDDVNRIESALDLCTGSGCLAILMAETLPQATVDAADISADALEVARRNVHDYGLDEVVNLIQSDVYAGLGERRYDLIISNPPYVTEAAMSAIPAEYRHEPALALVSGADGLDVVRQILAGAAAHLNDGGLLMVEVGHNADLVEAAWPDVPFTWVDAPSGESKVFLLGREELLAHLGG